MTQDQVIAAAREAGWSDLQLQMASPAELDRLAAFYRLAYRQGMERAAEICLNNTTCIEDEFYGRECADLIRAEAHAKNQPIGAHKEGD